jgi:hypothetical protein
MIMDAQIGVYAAINAVQADLNVEGITKNRKNTQQNYNFRGIDDVYNALSPLLAKHGLCILPRILTRSCEERQTKSGGSMSYVTVEAEFDFVCAKDGSKHVVRTFGEAMDSADKATNKAMSAAYKYAAFQAFAIPTEGDNDADAHTPQTTKAAPRQQPSRPTPQTSPAQTQKPAPAQQSAKPIMATKDTLATLSSYYANDPEEVMLDDINEMIRKAKTGAPRIDGMKDLTEAQAQWLIKQIEAQLNPAQEAV